MHAAPPFTSSTLFKCALGLAPLVPLLVLVNVFAFSEDEQPLRAAARHEPPSAPTRELRSMGGSGNGEAPQSPPKAATLDHRVRISQGYGQGQSSLKGAFWTAHDERGTNISLQCGPGTPCFDTSKDEVCVSGTTAAVGDDTYEAVWGAALAWNLNQERNANAQPYDLQQTEGLSFVLTMAPEHTGVVRFEVTAPDGEYCSELSSGRQVVKWENLERECWTPGGAPLPSDTAVTAVKWQVVTHPQQEQPFSFCVRSLSSL